LGIGTVLAQDQHLGASTVGGQDRHYGVFR
jgi:hypothetical protein